MPYLSAVRASISIHALCEEGDLQVLHGLYVHLYFYPRPLRGGRLLRLTAGAVLDAFLSTPSARRATSKSFTAFTFTCISIHALCEEGDFLRLTAGALLDAFLSTPSARRATTYRLQLCGRSLFLSTPSARRATRYSLPAQVDRSISIHALCEEGDHLGRGGVGGAGHFYPRPLRGGRRAELCAAGCGLPFLSTPSARRATTAQLKKRQTIRISIHALCEEGDWAQQSTGCTERYFYPRPLRGGRRAELCAAGCGLPFLSTPSARRATCYPMDGRWTTHISIHALCEEGDLCVALCIDLFVEFLSTPSARRATKYFLGQSQQAQDFYPRPLRGGRQQKQRQNLYFQTNYTTFCTNLEEP